MNANPFLGVFFHWLGGLASGSFYVPYKGVRKWAWEVYWLVGGVFSWIICPWVLATLMTSDAAGVLRVQSGSTLFWAYFFGAMWGFGGLTFGLTMRYLGMSLGMGVALGYCAAFGTLVPPIFRGEFGSIMNTWSGQVTLIGVAVCLAGIAVAACAGLTKEREMPEEEKKKTIAEFNFTKGILVATFSGIMSACFAFGLAAGKPIEDATYCSDIIHSAAKTGKTIRMPELVDSADAAKLVATLKGNGFFRMKDGKEQDANLNYVLETLEAPIVFDARVADLKAQDAKVDAQSRADVAHKLETATQELADATAAMPEKLEELQRAGGPLAARLQQYQASLEGLRGNVAVVNTIAGLKDLARKEVAVSAVDAGADYLSLHGQHQLWTGLPVLIVVLLGGFTTNFLWCLLLNVRNRTGYQYFSATLRREPPKREDETIIETAIDAPSEEMVVTQAPGAQTAAGDHRVPVLRNYFFSALAGTTWYFQFFFYTMGATQMGKYDFASWTLHMASIIIFSTLWGVALHEWKGSSKRTHVLIAIGLAVLVLSTVIVGYGNYLKAAPPTGP
jgi:hypothetical protein